MKKTTSVLLLIISCFSQAAVNDWMYDKTITDLIIENNHAVIVLDDEEQTANIPAECASKWLLIDLADDHGKAMYALVLAARMNDKQISLTSNACFSTTRPLVNRVRR